MEEFNQTSLEDILTLYDIARHIDNKDENDDETFGVEESLKLMEDLKQKHGRQEKNSN